MSLESPLVSVVIPTYNSDKYLDECLKAIQNQTHNNTEIIVVDSNSNDQTVNIAEALGAEVLQMKGVGIPNAKRNYGAKKSHGEYIFHLDSDMVAEPNVIEDCLERFRDNDVDALDIREKSIALTFWAECIASNRGSFFDNNVILPRFFRRDVVENIATDDDLLYGDDYAHYLRLKEAGYRIDIVDAYVGHYEPTSIMSRVKRNYETYKSFPNFARRYGAANSSFKTTSFIKSTLKKWVLSGQFVKDPRHFAGLLFLETMVFLAEMAGIFVGLIGIKFKSH